MNGGTQDVARLMSEAVAHQQEGRIHQAEWLYQAVLRLQPGHADANHNLGVAAMQANRPTDALDYLKAALEAKPEVGQYWLSYVAALTQAGHREAARQVLGQAMERGLGGAEAERLADQLDVSLAVAPAAEEIDHALKLFGQRRFAEVLSIAQTLTRRHPDHGFGWQLLGAALKESGRYQEALAPLQKACEILPDDAEARIELGLVMERLGRLAEAEAFQRNALELRADSAPAHFNLGNVLLAQGRCEEAAEHYRQALQAGGDFAEGHNNLGVCLDRQGNREGAAASFRRALELNPNYAEAQRNLAALLLDRGETNAAADLLQKAVRLDQNNADGFFLLGNAFNALVRQADAEAMYRRAIRLKPDHGATHSNLGALLQTEGRLAEAETHCRRAAALEPASAEAQNNLGFLLMTQGAAEEARQYLDRALELKPDFARAHANLGALLASQGLFAEGEASLHRALALDPDHEDAYGALLFALNYDPDKTAEEVFAAYRAYDERFGRPHRADWRPHANDRSTDRRLKVGYVSPDFNAHSTARFLEPLLAAHDRAAVEIYAYADLRRQDEVTARYRNHVDHWLPTLSMSDEALAERIRADGIDILVDLAGHTTGNRLGVFARKPAPVSVSWLGYGYTTGLSAIDYFLTDEATVPPGGEALFSERPWRLATPGFAYRPAPGMGEVSALPALERGQVTFGTLTRAVRLNDGVIRVWAEILRRVPGSRLVIDSHDFQGAAACEDLQRRFEQAGVAQDRVTIGYHTPPWDVLRSMDIGLDCFPHNSGTTLFESLYLGVPFVTLAGRPSVGRLGSSILEGIGHAEWIARTEEEYIDKAVALAGDLPRLAAIRANLRREMQASPLMDEAGFARRVEAAYRAMWTTWSEGQA